MLLTCAAPRRSYELLSAAGEWPELHAASVAAGHAAAGESTGGGAADGAAETDENDSEDSEDGVWEEGADGGYHRVGGKRKREGREEPRPAERSDGLSFVSPLVGNTVLRLHGKMSQRDRTQAFVRFRDLRSGIMIATDVAARGLNLHGVHWIVQYDLPQDAKEYLHRAGRTARLGQRGQALLLLHPTELPFLGLLRESGVTPRELAFSSLQAALCPGGRKRDVYVIELALQRQLEAAVKERAFLYEIAAAAYQSYLRGYAAHSKVVTRLVHVGQLHLGTPGPTRAGGGAGSRHTPALPALCCRRRSRPDLGPISARSRSQATWPRASASRMCPPSLASSSTSGRPSHALPPSPKREASTSTSLEDTSTSLGVRHASRRAASSLAARRRSDRNMRAAWPTPWPPEVPRSPSAAGWGPSPNSEVSDSLIRNDAVKRAARRARETQPAAHRAGASTGGRDSQGLRRQGVPCARAAGTARRLL